MTERRDRTRERLVRLVVAENQATAALVEDALRHAGIRCLRKDTDAAAVTLGGNWAAPWSVEIWVLEGDADAAAAILGGVITPPALPPPRTRRRRMPWGRRQADDAQ